MKPPCVFASTFLIVLLCATGNAQVTFTDVSDSAGPGLGVGTARGFSWVDFNNDGFEDLYVPTAGTTPNSLHMNNGNGTFTEIAAVVGLNDLANTITCSWADIDNDGDLDLVTTATGAPTRLWRNNRETGFDTTFTSIESSAGILMSGAQMPGWADYNNDGYVDFYSPISGSATLSDALYRNNGNNTFTNVADSAGVNHQVSGSLDQAVHWGDYDGDRDPDLFIGNLQTGGPSYFHRNNGDGTFTEIAASLGFAGSARGSQWVDFNNDGLRDFSVAGYAGGATTIPVKLYRNNGNGTFTDVASAVGLGDLLISWGVTWADYDNNGYEDLFVAVSGQSTTCQLYANNGDGTFTNMTDQSGLGSLVQLSGSWGDYDVDGDMDLYTSGSATNGNHLFRNNRGTGSHWLKTRLVGTGSNRAGIGATVIVKAGTLRMTREVNTGIGYRSQNMLTPHFGLAGNLAADSVIVFWPGGATSILSGVAADQTVTIIEPPSAPFPRISILPDTLTLVGSNAYTDTLVVFNTGTAPLHVDTIYAGPSVIPPFGVALEIVPWTFTLLPGDSQFVRVQLGSIVSPVGYAFVDSLFVVSDDQVDSVSTVVFRGDYPSDAGDRVVGPLEFHLEQNYPNPFNPETRIQYTIPEVSRVTITVFNMLGQEVRTLVNALHNPSLYSILWDGTDDAGRSVATGIYLCTFTATATGRTFVASRKITFIK